MDLLSNLMLGLQTAMTFQNLLYCFIGVFLGTLVGALPGIGALAAMSLLLPITYHIGATPAMIMLAGVYYGTNYGGSIASILLNLPGTPSNAVTCLDGYQMAQNGRAGVALLITALSSWIGGMIGVALMILFSPGIVAMSLQFGPAEYFSIMFLGLMAASVMNTGSTSKNLAMVALGLLLGVIGTDVNSGASRFTFGFAELTDGISIVVLAMGLFGVAEIMSRINHPIPTVNKDSMGSMRPTAEEWRRSFWPTLRGSGIGSFFGALPGTGPSISSAVSYMVERDISKKPEQFGKGAIEGVASPEAANNAAAQTAFIPTMTLGVPGDSVMALMLAALIIQGITPGPMLMVEQPQLFWGLVMSFVIGNIMLLVLNIPFIGLWTRLLTIPYRILYPSVLVFIAIGAYSINNNWFDVITVMLLGLLGYGMRMFKFEPTPVLLGFVLGPLMEEYLRRSLTVAQGDFSVFFTRPISATFLIIAGLLLVWSLTKKSRSRKIHS